MEDVLSCPPCLSSSFPSLSPRSCCSCRLRKGIPIVSLQSRSDSLIAASRAKLAPNIEAVGVTSVTGFRSTHCSRSRRAYLCWLEHDKNGPTVPRRDPSSALPGRYYSKVLLHELVMTSAAVAEASSRLVKIRQLAAL